MPASRRFCASLYILFSLALMKLLLFQRHRTVIFYITRDTELTELPLFINQLIMYDQMSTDLIPCGIFLQNLTEVMTPRTASVAHSAA